LGGLSNQVIRTAQQLIWVPLFLASFGPEKYGEWLVLVGIAGFASVADLGVQVFWLNLLTRLYARGEFEKYRRVFRAGLLLFLVVGGLFLIASLVFSELSGPSRVSSLKFISENEATSIFLIFVGTAFLSLLANAVRGVYRSVGQNPKVVWFEVGRELLTFVLIAAGLYINSGPVALASIYGLISLGTLVFVVVTVWRSFPTLVNFRLSCADFSTAKAIVHGGSFQLAGVLANLILIQGTLIVTNWALGATAVALIATTRTISNLVRQVAGSVYAATLPEFSRLEATADDLTMRVLFHRSSIFVLFVSGFACIVLIGVGPWMFDQWTGGRFKNPEWLIFLFAASVVVDSLRMPFHDFLLGCNRIVSVSIADIVYALCSLGLMTALFNGIGVLAVPVATIVCGLALHFPLMAKLSASVLSKQFIVQILVKMGRGTIIVVFSGLPLIVASLTQRISLFESSVYVIAALVVYVFLYFHVVFDRAELAGLKVSMFKKK
jgi:O-antigen/teichoic acid export membrane protein